MAAPTDTDSSAAIRSLIPAWVDRLPWSRFHTRLIAANVGPDLTQEATLNMSAGG